MDEFQNYGNINGTDNAPESQHGSHGNGGFPAAPEGTGTAMGESEQSVEVAHDSGVGSTVSKGLRGTHKDTQKLRCPNVGGDANKSG